MLEFIDIAKIGGASNVLNADAMCKLLGGQNISRRRVRFEGEHEGPGIRFGEVESGRKPVKSGSQSITAGCLPETTVEQTTYNNMPATTVIPNPPCGQDGCTDHGIWSCRYCDLKFCGEHVRRGVYGTEARFTCRDCNYTRGPLGQVIHRLGSPLREKTQLLLNAEIANGVRDRHDIAEGSSNGSVSTVRRPDADLRIDSEVADDT